MNLADSRMPVESTSFIVAEKSLKCVSVRKRKTSCQYDRVTDFDAAQSLLKPFFDKEPYEVVYAIALDSSNRFPGFLKLEEGTVNSASVHLRKILSFLLCETNATGLIIAHNHPGGCIQPSREDIALTKKIFEKTREIEVRLLDHIIYVPGAFGNKSEWISMQQLGNVPA
jgi:DNA repair protein RadC